MKTVLTAAILIFWCTDCLADDISGPGHRTIIKTSWGSIFYNPVAIGPHHYESKINDIRITSNQGVVKVLGSEGNGYQLHFDEDLLTIKHNIWDLEIRWDEKFWFLRSYFNRYTFESNAPEEHIVFERNANSFTIKGTKGHVTVKSNYGVVSVESSAGNASVSDKPGTTTFSGIPFDQIPYLGKGVYISFHGVGILIDIERAFPMPEVSRWVSEWKPIIGRPFE